MTPKNTGFRPESLRLIAAALALHQAERIATSITPLPGTDRFIAIGTPAEVARLLEIAPAARQSPAPIPEQVAQASGIEELTRYAEHWSGVGMAVDKTGEYVLFSQVERLLATQSVKQSNLQEENRQLRERIEDLTTAANQCINDAIGRSAQEVTQQAAKAETNESAEHDEIKTWPERIYLQCENEHGDGVEHYGTAGQEITWCQDCISKFDVEYVRADLAPTTSTVSASTVEYVPIAVNSHDEAGGSHPNDRTPADSECQKALDARGDDSGQGLDPYWKWGFRAGWHDHKRIAALSSTVSASGALAAADDVRDAKRYRLLRQHVMPGAVSLPMRWMPPPFQTIQERIDMLCDTELERTNRAAQAATDKSED